MNTSFIHKTKPAGVLITLFSVAVLVMVFQTAWGQFDLGDNEQSAAIEMLETTAASKGYSLLTLLQKTGWFVYPMALFSLYAVYLIIFNLLSLRENKLIPPELLERSSFHLAEKDLGQLQALIADRNDLVATMLRSGLTRVGHDRHLIQQAMESALSGPIVKLRIRYRRLADIGNLAPMLGLLGTVWGMIQVFEVIASDSASMIGNWSSALANGVAMAMVTTVEGLLIAIPSLFFYYVFRNRMSRLLGQLEMIYSDLSDLLCQAGHPDGVPQTDHQTAAQSNPINS